MITIFKKSGPGDRAIYALLEAWCWRLVGSHELRYPGIAIQAVA